MRHRWLIVGLPVLALTSAFSVTPYLAHRSNQIVAAKLEQLQGAKGAAAVPCSEFTAAQPLVLLVLGQSNAANQSELDSLAPGQVRVFHDGHCLLARDPLPGGSGRGGSLWPHVAALLQSPAVFSMLAVDATSVGDWTREGSPLRSMLVAHVAAMRRENLAPSLVLWQQGEADAIQGTSQANYQAGLVALRSVLDGAGSGAPVLLARSTVCRSPPNEAIRHAVLALAAADARWRLGPDTDTLLTPENRLDGCHFSVNGLRRAAVLWKDVIEVEVRRMPSPKRP